MAKKIRNPKKVSVKKTSFSRKMDELENLRGTLVVTALTLSDLIDDLTGYSRVNKKRNQ